MTTVKFHADAMRDLERNPKVADALAKVADQIASEVAPRLWPQLSVRTRRGVSRRGAFAQTRVRGQGALVWEYGSRTQPARAHLRNALRRKRQP